MADSKAITERRRHLVDILEKEGRLTISQIVDKMTGVGGLPELGKSKPRTGKYSDKERANWAHTQRIKRDLESLEAEGMVQRVENHNAGGFSGEGRVRAAQCWEIKGDPNIELDLVDIASRVALEVLTDYLRWVVPPEVSEDFKLALQKAQKRIGRMGRGSPESRWLSSLKIMGPYSEFDRPEYNGDIRAGIENAIKTARKVRIKYSTWYGVDFDGVATIENIVIRLPDVVSIVIWEDNDFREQYFPEHPMTSFEIPVDWIESVDVLDVPAYMPRDIDLSLGTFDPLRNKAVGPYLASGRQPFPTSDVDRDEYTYEFRASPKQMLRWRGRWIGERIEIIGVDEDGWSVCRYFDRNERGFLGYLRSLAGEVEVLSPYGARVAFEKSAKEHVARYESGQALPPSVLIGLEEKLRARTKRSELEFAKKNPPYIRELMGGFTKEDELRLRNSTRWLKDPEPVELICLNLSLHDLMLRVVESEDLERSRTEYLVETERLCFGLEGTASASELESMIRFEFPDAEVSGRLAELSFNERSGYWKEIADSIWSDLTLWRLSRRRASLHDPLG